MAAKGKLRNGKPFWAIAVENGRKTKKDKFLHYISTHIDGSRVITSEKEDVLRDRKKQRTTRVVPLLKDVYDKNFSAEDRADQAGAATQGKMKCMRWERVVIGGLINLFIAENARLLYEEANPENGHMKPADFVVQVAYDLAGYDPGAKHQLVQEHGYGNNCAVCRWWRTKRERRHKIRRARTRCERCNVRVCDNCFTSQGGYRHAIYVVEAK